MIARIHREHSQGAEPEDEQIAQLLAMLVPGEDHQVTPAAEAIEQARDAP